MSPVLVGAPVIWTIGHSTRSIADFEAALTPHGIELVADIRRFPASRRLPQFGSAALAAHLAAHDILYHWIAALGGRRRPDADSTNLGWRHPAFRGYADYLATDEFAEGLFELSILATGLRTVIMCAEVLWWRCHRRLLADALTYLGWQVIHLRNAGPGEVHRLSPPARVVRGRLLYALPAAANTTS